MLLWLLVSFLCFFSISAYADNTSATQLNEVDVIGKLDQERNSIEPSLGASDYNIGTEEIDDESQGNAAFFNQVILRMPGAAQDSFGQLHIRGEHANLQYRINDVVLPEGLTGFGQELDTRFIDNVSLIDGSLPAQYGFHTAGIIDIHTKTGAFNNGGTISVYGGSHGEVNPSLSYGGSGAGGINYFVTSSYLEDDLGIENPTNGASTIHDQTQEGKMFAYVSKVIDDSSRLSVMLSASHSDFQIPNSPGGSPFFDSSNAPFPLPYINSTNVNDRQVEQNFYGIAAYQKAQDKLNYQLSAFTRFSEVNYLPDPIGDLEYNGVAATINDSILTDGLELDGSYELNDTNTLRAGTMLLINDAVNDNKSLVFPVDGSGNLTGAPEESIIDNHTKTGEQYGLYLQDEWKVTDPLTINYGGRFDQSYEYLNEYQFSPRVNAVYQVDETTKVHGGYARYFTPAPPELEQSGNPAIYNGTTAALTTLENSPVKAERSNYFDLGATHQFSPEFNAGIDGYYKIAQDQLDEGQFGAAPIFVPFNYKYGKVDGVEFTGEYKKGGLSVYSNTALSASMGRDIVSAQFQDADPNELAYISGHWIHMDHDQFITGSGGIAYEFDGSPYALLNKTKLSADILYGSGLRAGFANEEHTGFYNPINLGLEHTVHLTNFPEFKVRFDIVNVFDEVYELRDGTGIGVYAPQYGPCRGYYGGFSMDF